MRLVDKKSATHIFSFFLHKSVLDFFSRFFCQYFSSIFHLISRFSHQSTRVMGPRKNLLHAGRARAEQGSADARASFRQGAQPCRFVFNFH
jgi:hypothetical protein